jgi:hypothetical protein
VNALIIMRGIYMPLDTVSNSARAELAAVNAQLVEAMAKRDEAQHAHDRLAKPARLLEEAVAQHAAEKAVHDAQLVEWYTNGCNGARPPAPPSLLLAEHRIGEARRDLGASETALEAAKNALQAANEDLARLQSEAANDHSRFGPEPDLDSGLAPSSGAARLIAAPAPRSADQHLARGERSKSPLLPVRFESLSSMRGI